MPITEVLAFGFGTIAYLNFKTTVRLLILVEAHGTFVAQDLVQCLISHYAG